MSELWQTRKSKREGYEINVTCSTTPVPVKNPGLTKNRSIQKDYNAEINFRECKIDHISSGFISVESKMWQLLQICKKIPTGN